MPSCNKKNYELTFSKPSCKQFFENICHLWGSTSIPSNKYFGMKLKCTVGLYKDIRNHSKPAMCNNQFFQNGIHILRQNTFLSRNCFKYFYSSFYLFTLPMGTLLIIWVKGNHIYHLNMNACCVPCGWKTLYIPTPRPHRV